MGMIDFGWRDFEPVALTGRFCNLISVSANSEYQTLEDLMEAARSGEDPVLVGVNIGGQNHILPSRARSAIRNCRWFPRRPNWDTR